MIFLRTGRIELRRFTPADAPLIYELDSDPEVMRHISKGIPTPLEKVMNEILPRWTGFNERFAHLGYWAAHESATNRFVGFFHLRPDPYEAEAQELGYRLRRDAWGRGYATEVSRALIEHAFRNGGIERITARTLVGNIASRHVLEKCGMRCEETFTYPLDLLPGWTEDERAAVKYGIRRSPGG